MTEALCGLPAAKPCPISPKWLRYRPRLACVLLCCRLRTRSQIRTIVFDAVAAVEGMAENVQTAVETVTKETHVLASNTRAALDMLATGRAGA